MNEFESYASCPDQGYVRTQHTVTSSKGSGSPFSGIVEWTKAYPAD